MKLPVSFAELHAALKSTPRADRPFPLTTAILDLGDSLFMRKVDWLAGATGPTYSVVGGRVVFNK